MMIIMKQNDNDDNNDNNNNKRQKNNYNNNNYKLLSVLRIFKHKMYIIICNHDVCFGFYEKLLSH